MRLAIHKRFLGTPFARVTAVIVAVMLASALGVSLAILKLREDAINEAVVDAANISTILAEQAGNAVQSIELVVDELIHNISQQRIETAESFQQILVQQDVHNFLLDRLGSLPQADVVTITDAQGDILSTTRSWPRPQVNLADRDYFQYLKDNRDGRIFISEPVVNRVTATWNVYFGKRITARDGTFLGVVVIGVRPEFFLRTLDVVSSIPGQSLLLLRRDGLILLRHPDQVQRAGERMPAGSEWYKVVSKGGGSYRSPGFFDHAPRHVAVRPLTSYPIVIDIAVSEDYLLETWRKRATVFGAVTLIIELAFAFLLRELYNRHKSTLRSQALLAQQSEELRLSNVRFDAALTHMSHGIAMYDAQSRLLIHNRQYELIWGMSSEELPPGIPLSEILEKRVRRGLFAGNSSEAYMQRHLLPRDRRYTDTQKLSNGRTVLITVDPMPDGGWVTTHEDVTEQQEAAAKIAHMAHHDPLTDLANRSLFINRLQEFLTTSDSVVVYLIDLDHFKDVNDTLGHAIGDELLQQVARRLRDCIGLHDVVARLGGDEFAIARPLWLYEDQNFLLSGERVLASIQSPYRIEGHDVSIGLSIGIAQAMPGGGTEQIMRHGDLALYRAKSEGRNCMRVFEPLMEEQVHTRRQLAIELQDALLNEGLQAYYQPILNTQTLNIRTMEALLRWPHPKRGMVPPPEFIALAEEAGLIHRLGEWILRRACLDAKHWPDNISVAVNVSALQISQSSMPAIVARILDETGLPARRLKLEITETVLLADSGRALATLHALRQLGIAIALDDFGTGYSSLSYLKMFPFDELKIDKSFIDDMVVHRGCAAIVSATTSLARAFDIVTTAEGVETREQFELLRAATVTQVQGYYFARPAPASAWNFESGTRIEAR